MGIARIAHQFNIRSAEISVISVISGKPLPV